MLARFSTLLTRNSKRLLKNLQYILVVHLFDVNKQKTKTFRLIFKVLMSCGRIRWCKGWCHFGSWSDLYPIVVKIITTNWSGSLGSNSVILSDTRLRRLYIGLKTCVVVIPCSQFGQWKWMLAKTKM